ncbi:unnamed protein product [Hermetia illucens]|uniref:Cuticle protein 6 n=2 Tax=Hermetia illucens TaxID=343691 RepID=A0A7R8YPV5_HERIL|nr:unnamed protein product [Hermetia illucens]
MDTNHSTKLIVFTILSLVTSTFSRSVRGHAYRQLPTAPVTYAQFPSYNIQEPNGPGTYAFGFEFEDPASGNIQFRDEERLANGTVRGSYGYVRPDGMLTLTRYWDDGTGYRSETETFNRVEGPGFIHPVTPMEPTHNPTQRPIDHTSHEQPSLSPEQVEQILHNHHQIDLAPSYNPLEDRNIVDPDLATVLDGKQPLLVQSKDGKEKFAVQFVNNFIPTNFPVVSFHTPFSTVNEVPFTPQSDPVEVDQIVNDKFHDPIFDERLQPAKRRQNVRNPANWKQQKNQGSQPMMTSREALWFRKMIQNRRRDYLQKYNMDYDLVTIPADYVVKPRA